MNPVLARAVASVVLEEVERQGWTDAEFARRSGMTKHRVWRFLRADVKGITIDDVELMSAGLGWTMTRLVDTSIKRRNALAGTDDPFKARMTDEGRDAAEHPNDGS